ncbi:hypothetical protein LG302_16215 [Halomonas organivorans]
MSIEQGSGLPPDAAFMMMQKWLSDQHNWSSLSVTLEDIAKENKELVQDLTKYDPHTTLPLIASILTVPRYQPNCLRLELLATLAWKHCKGKKKANISQITEWFQTIGKSRSASGEDPAEDVFTSLIMGKHSDFRIIEGLWESAGFYTQIIYDIVQTMPNQGHWATIKRCVNAILTVSEIVCQNADLVRYQTGGEFPKDTLSSRHLPSRNALIKRVCIPLETLETRGVHIDDIAPFIADPQFKEEVGNQRASQTSLHFRPLITHDSKSITVALPSCLSLAMREYVIEEIFDNNRVDAFDKVLAQRFSELLYDTPLLGGPRNAPVYWRKVRQHRVSSLGFQFDEGHFISFHFFLPSIISHADGGFADTFRDDGSITEEIQNDILASMERFEKKEDFQSGLILIIGCGWGKGYAIQDLDVKRENWHFSSISIADLIRSSWMTDMNPEYFWRIQEGLSEVEKKGVNLINPNGILNLIGWIRSNDGHFVPHAQLPPDPITPDHPLILNLPLNMLRDIRTEADNELDKHGLTDESGQHHIVQRASPGSLFESESSKKIYGSITALDEGKLTSCYEGKFHLWVSIETPNTNDKNLEYRLWEMSNEWLHRIGKLLDNKFGCQTTPTPMRTNLLFLDGDIPDSMKEKPGRPDLEKLCILEVSQERSCTTATFEPGFINGFMVAENIAERVIVSAMLSGFLRMTLRELPVGILKSLENNVVPNDDARSFHFFQAQGFLDYVRQLLPDKVTSVDKVDDGIAKLGLAWRVRNRLDGQKIQGLNECTAFLNKVVDCLLSDIEKELSTLPRSPFLHMVIKNIEKSHAEADHWRRTSAAVLGLHGKSENTLRQYVQQSSKFAAGGIASCRVPDDQMSYRSYPLLAAKELLQQFIREQGYGHQAT